MKKTYESPEYRLTPSYSCEVIMTSTDGYDIGDGDWGVQDEL